MTGIRKVPTCLNSSYFERKLTNCPLGIQLATATGFTYKISTMLLYYQQFCISIERNSFSVLRKFYCFFLIILKLFSNPCKWKGFVAHRLEIKVFLGFAIKMGDA